MDDSVKFKFRAMSEPARYNVYANKPDGLPTPPDFKWDGWIGRIQRCPGHVPASGRWTDVWPDCGRWHVSTGTTQLPGHPEYSDRIVGKENAARALFEIRCSYGRQYARLAKGEPQHG